MTSPGPIICTYNGDGEFKAVSSYWEKRADREYVCGEQYSIAPQEDRSGKTHRHYFIVVNEAHANLPDHLLRKYPTPDHLRRYALIKAGFCDVQTVTCATPKEALRWARVAQGLDEYALVDVVGSVVTIYRAKSQSYKAMPKGEFARSKEAVLGVLADMIGVEPSTLSKHAEAA